MIAVFTLTEITAVMLSLLVIAALFILSARLLP